LARFVAFVGAFHQNGFRFKSFDIKVSVCSRLTGASPTFPGESFSATGIAGSTTIARILVARPSFVRPIACGPFL